MARADTSASNSSLHAARAAKNDEFYTQISDIEKELRHYKDHLKGKVIFCNCDDPEWSNFWRHFTLKFEDYGLAKVVATHYAQGEPSYKLEFTGKGQPAVRTPLQGDGDFRSDECVEILKSADIVVTNPPFSLFREYLAQLIEHRKNFLIMGNNNAVTYKEVFKLIRDNVIWQGQGVNKTMEFRLADDYARWSRVDEHGRKYGKVPAISWFTNLTHQKRNEELLLFRAYAGNEHLYPKYDNYDAIEVSRVSEIPADYEGVMGVPITFLDKYNPSQFRILGMASSAGYNQEIVGIPFLGQKDARPLLSGKNTYARVLIKRVSTQ